MSGLPSMGGWPCNKDTQGRQRQGGCRGEGRARQVARCTLRGADAAGGGWPPDIEWSAVAHACTQARASEGKQGQARASEGKRGRAAHCKAASSHPAPGYTQAWAAQRRRSCRSRFLQGSEQKGCAQAGLVLGGAGAGGRHGGGAGQLAATTIAAAAVAAVAGAPAAAACNATHLRCR